MRPEVIKKIRDEAERNKSAQIPLRLPLPEPENNEQEEVSVISHVIEIEL